MARLVKRDPEAIVRLRNRGHWASGRLFRCWCWDRERESQVLPALQLSEADLPRGDEAVEQGQGGIRRGEAPLGLHPAPELQVEALDAIRGAPALPLAPGIAKEGEQLGPGFLQARRPRPDSPGSTS